MLPMPSSAWVRMDDMQSAFAVCKALLDDGGNGLIEPLWDGQVPDRTPITTFPDDDVADPEGRPFSMPAGAVPAMMAGLMRPSPLP